jgi:hypothetical protein
VYADGSKLYATRNTSGIFTSLGWAFAVVDPSDTVVASASGIPPKWVEGIYGAELWALLNAAQNAFPGSPFYIDCKAVQLGAKNGPEWAGAPVRKLGRAWIPLAGILHDSGSDVNWMPAHCTPKDIGTARLSNGQYMTESDLQSNGLVDTLAKDEAKKYFPRQADKRSVTFSSRLVECIAKWIGQCTHAANSFPTKGDGGKTIKIRDSCGMKTTKRKRPGDPTEVVKARKRPKVSPSTFVSVTSEPRFSLPNLCISQPSSSSSQPGRDESSCSLFNPPVPKRRKITEQQHQLKCDATFHTYWLKKGAGKNLRTPQVDGRERIEALRRRLSSMGPLP